MPDIHIERPHAFGLARARALAVQWTADAESRFGMRCSSEPGRDADTIHFERPGVTGSVRVEADRFTLDAQLGFLLAAFRGTIEAEVVQHLDALLASAAAAPKRPAARKPSATAAKTTAGPTKT